MVLMSQRDGLGSASQAPRDRTSGTREATDVPAVGQRSGAQGPDSEGSAFRSGVWVRSATLTWLQGWAGGAGEGIASSDRTLLLIGERRGGRECGDWVSCTAILALLGPGEKGNCSFFDFGYHWLESQWRNRIKREQKIPPGEGVVRSPSPEEQDPETPGRPSQDRRLPGASQVWQGQRRAAPLSCGQLHAVAVVKAAAEAELERRWRPQEGAFGDEQTEGLQPAVGWRQQRTAGAGCVETPPSAVVAENCWAKPSTASPNRPAWEIGESKKRCLSDSLISAKVSHRWRSWTTNVDIVWPRARAVTFVARRARSVAVNQLGQHHPRATALTPWPGGLAGGPWRAGRKRPVQQHCKPWPSERTRTYRPWTEGVDYPSRRQRPAGRAACNGALNWGDLHIPLGRPTVEGGEDGGGTRPVSGRKRCLPRPSHLLMHFRENGTGGGCRDRPAPPGTNRPASSVREKEEASSAARRSQRPGKA